MPRQRPSSSRRRTRQSSTSTTDPKNSSAHSKHGGNDDDDDSRDASQKGTQDGTPLRFVVDPAGELTHDETTVDVVTVPCPGGDAIGSWSRDGLVGRYFGAPSMREAAAGNSGNGRGNRGEGSAVTGHSWVRQGIRREAPRARILLYEHPSADDSRSASLEGLADAFLDELDALRGPGGRARPVVFVAHSVGGLFVKMALARASRSERHDAVLRECYGVAFFATPHQGSSYLAMSSLATSIQALLRLSSPLPTSITDSLRVGNSLLQRVDEDFKAVSNDVRVWTFYETIESRLSAADDVYLTAPLTSIKSAVLGMRQETIFALQSDHANIASFGHHNMHSLRHFLRQLALQVSRADMTLRDGDGAGRWTLELERKVSVEVHGFFDDPPAAGDAHDAVATIRSWSTRVPLSDFLVKGPDGCLSERLSEVVEATHQVAAIAAAEPDATAAAKSSLPPRTVPVTVQNVRAMQDRQAATRQTVVPGSPIIHPVIAPAASALHAQRIQSTASEAAGAHLGLTTIPSQSLTPVIRQPAASSVRPPSLIQADLEQDLAVDRLSPPLRPRVGRSISRSFSLGSDRPRLDYREFIAVSPRSRSALNDMPPALGNDGWRGLDGSADDDNDHNNERDRQREGGGDGAGGRDDDEDADVEAVPRLPEAVLAIRKVAAKIGRLRGSDATAVDEAPAAAAFARPGVQARRFVWVHVPFNNPSWVKNVLQTLEVSYKMDLSTLYGHEFWATRHTRGRHSQHYAYFAKPGCYFTSSHTMSPRPSIAGLPLSAEAGVAAAAAPDSALFTCLFLPYLHFDSYRRLIRRRNLIMQRLGYGRSRPVPQSVAKSDLLELQVVWEFLGHDPPINCRRTLDQFAYPSLRDTRSRDDDQMLYKLTKERGCAETDAAARGSGGVRNQGSCTGTVDSKSGGGGGGGGGSGASTTSAGWRERMARRAGGGGGENAETGEDVPEEETVRNGNVLMVDQLWLWVIGSHTLASFFPKRESDPIEGPLFQQADLRDSIFNDVNVDLTRQCQNALDLAALAALHAVSVLLDRSSHPDLEVFRIFEEAISALTEKLTWSLKRFRLEGFRDKAFDYEPVENKARSIRARHKAESRRAERENRDNTSALLELRDMEDELLSLVHLFERQTKVLTAMLTAYSRPELRDHTANGRVFLSEALKRLRDYAQQADEMTQRVRTTRDEYDKLLHMVQRQAQVDEVRLSRLHADLASAQSRSVTIFTTFTVIFLPLTFFTGLFGMNTKEWGGANNLPLHTIGLVALPSSFFVVVAALFIAFSTRARKLLRHGSRVYGRLVRGVGGACSEAARRVAGRGGGKGSDGTDGGSGGGGGGGGGDGDGEWDMSTRARDDADGGTATPGVNKQRKGRGPPEREASDFWERHRFERERGYHIPEANRARGLATGGGGVGSGGGNTAGLRMAATGTRMRRGISGTT